MLVKIELSNPLGADLGPFDLTANVGNVIPSSASRFDLLNGIIVTVDDAATGVTVTSNSSSGCPGTALSLTITGIPNTEQRLRLTFDDIANADLLVGNASDVNNWNTFLNLPTNGNPYTNVAVSGNTVTLTGGSNVTIGTFVFDEVDTLLKVEDNGTVVEVATNGFYYCWNIYEMTLLSATTIGNLAFELCEGLQVINLSSCQNLGTTVGDNGVFDQIDQNANITLTVPLALTTVNSGSPDGDIQYLQANNNVSIVTV